MRCWGAIRLGLLGGVLVGGAVACGGNKQDASSAADDVDPVAVALGGAEVEPIHEEEAEAKPAAHDGPTKLTINLKVVNDKNPEGSYRLLDANGAAAVENGKLGDTVEVPQGAYTLEFKSPLVFGEPLYLSDTVDVAGPEMTVDEIFPAGQITLHTFKGNNEGKCVPTPYTVFDLENQKDVPGKGKTCSPLVVQTGHYEVRLAVGKNKIQPVEMRINREQVQTSKVKLEK